MAGLSREVETMLAEKARHSDGEAFARLVENNSGSLRNHIRARIWGSEDDVDDIMQDTWAEIWVKIQLPADAGGYDHTKSRFYNWVKVCVAKYKILQWRNDRVRQVRSLVRAVPSAGEDTRDDEGHLVDLRAILPEVLAQIHEGYEELSRLVFLCGGYPHQQLAFALSQHIYGTRSEGGNRGDSRTVDQKHGGELLNDLVKTYQEAYCMQAGMNEKRASQRISEHLEPVRKRLLIDVASLLQNDPVSTRRLQKMRREIVGQTCLRNYYDDSVGGYSAAIPDWCNKVKARVRRVLDLGSEACRKCKLRHLPPCELCTTRNPPNTSSDACQTTRKGGATHDKTNTARKNWQ